MATILLVEDEADLGLYEAHVLADAGHRVVRCGGGPTVFGPCPLFRSGACGLVDGADVILFSCRMFAPIRGRRYGGLELLRAYRSHPLYGRKPMVVVSGGLPEELPGTGPMVAVDKFADPGVVIRATERMLEVSAEGN